MTSPVRPDSYLPVDPDTCHVHDWLVPDVNRVTTKCDLEIPWVKNILLIPTDGSYPLCPTCWKEDTE